MGRMVELVSPGRFEVRDVEQPLLEPEDIRVSVYACGICGSDLERFAGKGRQRYPVVLGHEISGVVMAVGPKVDRVHVGDLVVVVPIVPCFHCSYCVCGDFTQCLQYSFIGSRRAGGFASEITIPAKNAVSVPDGAEIEAAALVEPLSVGSHALRRALVGPSDTLAILGAGSIGLCAAVTARFLGVQEICLFDLLAERVDHARRLGLRAEVVPKIDAANIADVVIEATGSAAAVRDAIRMAKPKGRVVYLGKMRDELSISVELWDAFLRKELALVTAWMSYSAPFPGEDWVAALSAIADHQTRVRDIVTHRIKLENVQECFDFLLANPGRFGKVLVFP